MAFLDNSGDIILDAVLTDTGRFRMARGDFRISKFALGDDEIDYSLYNRAHPSGSAYYDLEIFKTPLLEAFTNNTSMMKSKLLTLTRTNILYLPVTRLHNGGYQGTSTAEVSQRSVIHSNTGMYVITCDTNTEDTTDSLIATTIRGKGIIKGTSPTNNESARIVLETGLDTLRIPPSVGLPSDLSENIFIMEMDDRLGQIASINGTVLPVSFIDDDQVASYYINNNAGAGGDIVTGPLDNRRGDGTQDGSNVKTQHRIRGPRGNIVQFTIVPSATLATSTFLFEKLGSTLTTTSTNMDGFRSSVTLLHIDTHVRVTAATTGYSIDVPIRFVKKSG
jgi:hypothetical protein